MEKQSPLWWSKIYLDLKTAAKAAEKSFTNPGVVIGFVEDQDDKISFIIRLESGEAGYFSKEMFGNRDLPTGAKIKKNLPQPEKIVEDPDSSAFAYEVLREQIKLLPRLWLKRNIEALISGKDIQEPKLTFNEWVLLSPKKRRDRHLVNLLESAVKYEGLKGLARFNDYAS